MQTYLCSRCRQKVPRRDLLEQGEVNLTGRTRVLESTMRSPGSNTPSLIYRCVVERRERDSDGDSKWVTVSDQTRFVPFLLEDETGAVRVDPSGTARIALRRSWRQQRGDMRYTEYRVEPGDEVFVFGFAERDRGGQFRIGFEREGYYTPILSVYGETGERATMAGTSIAKVWFGVVTLAAGVSVLIVAFRIHRLLVYFSILNVLVAVYMVSLGLHMMRLDLQAGLDRLELHTRRTLAETALFASRDLFPKTARVPPLAGLILTGVSLVAGIGAFLTGFRRVRFKRCIENLPTSPTTGAAWGLAEFKGIVDVAPGADLLKGPLSSRPCVQYHYKIMEKRGSGKKSSWVTVLDQQRRMPFQVRDEEGHMLVDPAGATVYTFHSSRRGRHRRRYTETRLEYGDPVYAIGECRVEPVRGEQLYLTKPQDDYPFILSNFTENQVMLKVARAGITLLNVSFAAILLMALLLFGLSGSFAATDYLAAALTAPLFMTAVTLMLHYNDLVFLRERVRRNLSNIDVSLKKRHDLVPQLEQVTRGLTEHERAIQEGLSEMRTLYTQTVDRSPEGLARHLQAENELLERMILRVEAHPELVAGRQTALMMRTLILLENELALMRKGYNDAVETYNTRIAVFPDVLFAKMFGFTEMPLQIDGGAVLHVPPSVQAVWEREQAPPPLPPSLVADSEAGGEAGDAAGDIGKDHVDAPASPAMLAAAAGYEAEGAERAAEAAVCTRLLSLFEHEPGEPIAVLEKIEALCPEIRELTPAGYRTLRRQVAEAVETDNRVTFFEFALLQSMTRHLDPHFGLKPERPLRHRNFESLARPVSKLLSLIARTEADPATARAAFDEGVANLNHANKDAFTMMGLNPENLVAFEQVVEEITHATPMIRANVFYACEAAVRRGGAWTLQQQLLLFALADALERPRPVF